MSYMELKTLDDISDVLIIEKIKEKNPEGVTSNSRGDYATQCLCFESGVNCDCEINFFEEQQAIIKKQLQMLQADERGKQALISEIAALKQRQEERAQLLKNRQHALDIEKERARKIASLPPPLPKSVKLLLKSSDNNSKTDKADVQMPDELTANTFKPVERCYENKENIMDPKELETKQKIQEERQINADKRFSKALKKEREKKEYSIVMKQIQNAELLNRREMAKNISSDKQKGIPCPISDKFGIAKKQADMEEAAEKIFKRTSVKEHVIEDIEGYQDHYEEKYKKIDSNVEAKLIDCIPSFVKENYEYLLEDESKFEGGKHFSGFEDCNSDILNEAYIEASPEVDDLDEKEKIDLAISHLDNLRTSLQTEYEQILKPLLVTAMDGPKKELSDKAIETESITVLAEDKATGTDEQFKDELTSPSPTATFDYLTSGIMSHKRRLHKPILSTYEGTCPLDMHKRNVHYTVPSITHSEDLATGSWSSSSYCSLPASHGITTFNNRDKLKECDICVAEKEKNKDISPKRKYISPREKSDESTTSAKKVPLSKYIQQLARKHLVAKSPLSHMSNNGTGKTFNDSSLESKMDTVSPAFEKEIIVKSKAGLFVEHQEAEVPPKSFLPQGKRTLKSYPIIVEKPVVTEESKIVDPSETSVKVNKILKSVVEKENLQDDILTKVKNFDSPKSPVEYSDYDLEAKRIQAIHQVLSRRIPRFTLDNSPESEENNDENEEEKLSFAVQNKIDIKPYVYHELSTIQEVDSALTAGSLQLSQSKLSDTSETKEKIKEPLQEQSKGFEQSLEKLNTVSLLDPPDSEISELAKSIHFVPNAEKKESYSVEISTSSKMKSTSVSSKNLSTPSHISSSDSNSLSSFASGAKVFSSTLIKNQTNYPHLKDVKNLPNYFKDVSDIPKKVSTSVKSDSSLPPSEFLSSVPVSSSSLSIPSIDDINENQYLPLSLEPRNFSNSEIPEITQSSKCSNVEKAGYVPGYITEVLVPETAKPDFSHSKKMKDNVHPMISNYASELKVSEMIEYDTSLKPMTPHSDIPSPSELVDKNEPKVFTSSESFKSLTPHSNISSPDELADKNESTVFRNTESFKALTPHSNISSPSETTFNPHNQKVLKGIDSFKALTPHSSISSPSESNFNPRKYDQQDFRSTDSFKALTPHSNISSPSESDFNPCKYDQQNFRSPDSFKALTPHSNISSPSESAFNPHKHEQQDFRSPDSFKALTPHSNISSPSESAFNPHKYEQQDFRSPDSFKALTPHSGISSPSESAFHKDKYEQHLKSAGSFKVLTPHSNITSPSESAVLHLDSIKSCNALTPKSMVSSLSSSEDMELQRKMSSGSFDSNPVILRLNILTNSLSSDIKRNPYNAQKKSHFTCRVALKTHFLKPANHNDDEQIKQKQLHISKAKQYAQTCSSDFFVPSLNEDLISSNDKNDRDIMEDASNAKHNKEKPKLTIDSQVNTSSENFKSPQKLVENQYDTNANEKMLERETKGKPLVAESNEPNKNEGLDEFGKEKQSNKQHCNLQTASSTSSSTENLSVISGSKVLCQSTPIKNFSELIQEPGLLEEPDLTLITTDLSCKMDATRMNRDPLTSVLCKLSVDPEKDDIKPSENNCVTPISQNSHCISSPDTPSMLSFLHHEMSCLKTGNTSFHSQVENKNVAQSLSGNDIPQLKGIKEVKRSLFTRTDYKTRTKRLWNNLEEVKKRNLIEDRKREMEINRKKAKEFAKKLTPKHKGK